MTLEEAVRVLSEKRHSGRSDWYVMREQHRGVWVTVDDPDYREYFLSPFEAVAVAEWYRSGHTPDE